MQVSKQKDTITRKKEGGERERGESRHKDANNMPRKQCNTETLQLVQVIHEEGSIEKT